jgi:GT2 family glycosyltransferase
VTRPGVDVVVPFAGSSEDLRALLDRLRALALGPADTVVVVDNRRSGEVPADGGRVKVVEARAQPGSYYARNVGAGLGANPWILFLDADVEVPETILDDYFPVDGSVGVLVGAMVDEPVGARRSMAVRYAAGKRLMSQDAVLRRPEFAYAQTANCMVSRAAFEAVGGFENGIRSGGDADLCFRIRALGYGLEPRPAARVVHRSRVSLRALLRQRARVGSGAGWLESRYAGFAPRRPLYRGVGGGLFRAARAGVRRDVVAFVDGLADAAFQLGTRLPNKVGPR